MYMEPNLVQKSDYEVLEFEKNEIKLKSKASNFGRTQLKLLPKKPPHKFFNVKIRPKVLSKRKNCTTLI